MPGVVIECAQCDCLPSSAKTSCPAPPHPLSHLPPSNPPPSRPPQVYAELRRESSVTHGMPIAVRHLESMIRMSEVGGAADDIG